jgi:hypothetical protein
LKKKRKWGEFRIPQLAQIMGHIVEFRTNSSNNQKKPMKSSNMRGILCKGENNHAKDMYWHKSKRFIIPLLTSSFV